MDLLCHHRRFEHVLQHRLDDHAIDGAVGQRDRMPVADELDRRAGVDVEGDEVDIRVRVELRQAVTLRAASDHQNPGPPPDRGGVGPE
ncbi:hypothetical protein OK015_24030 [Mycobacterium sp. Aquia_216]|nr:hypothetical protein [Mycobacterium sp. Aquia_216]WAJ44182.1 hypothetical protein OK015_24030 [Mycobacterium sp. Aquia_216]